METPPAPNLSAHLAAYGLRDFFSSAHYLHWAGQQLGEPCARRMDLLRRPLEKDEARPDDVLRFYDFIADPAIASVVHSMKTDAIRAGGEAVGERIGRNNKVLDLGCNIGYLSTWYARCGDTRVTGVDVSARSIATAQQMAATLRCPTVRFVAGDIRKLFRGERFDAIIDTQTIYTIAKKKQVLNALFALLADEGVLITIPPLRSRTKLTEYLCLLSQAGFHARALDFIYFSALGVMDSHPLIEATKTASGARVDVDAAFMAMRRELLALSASA